MGKAGLAMIRCFGYRLCDHRSMADLAPEEKNRISHRGEAARALRPLLDELLLNLVAQLDLAE